MTAAGYLWRAWCDDDRCGWKGKTYRGAYGGRQRAEHDAVAHETITDGARQQVTLEYFKWPQRTGTPYKAFPMQLVGTDEFGTWLWSPPGVQPPGADYDSFLTLAPKTAWWVATWIRREEHHLKLWVDITTPGQWVTPERVTMVDLDIDVQRLPDGTIEILDEDQFADRAVAWDYPAHFVETAPAAARFIVTALGADDEPFNAVARHWLDSARAPA